jgi:hypothetical protein
MQDGGKTETESTPRNEALDSISIAAFEVDARIFRTMWHSLNRTPDVVLAALKGDYSTYLAPLRVFVALFSFQFAFAAIVGTPLTLTVTAIVAGQPDSLTAAWLASADVGGLELEDLDRWIEPWMAALMWPMMIIATLPYLAVLKLYRLKLSWWGHLTMVLVPTNASFVVVILSIPTLLLGEGLGQGLFVAGNLIAMLVYFGLTGWLLARFYAKSAWGTAFRMSGFVVLLPFSIIFSIVGQIVATGWLIHNEFGLSLSELFLLIAESSGAT